MPNTRNQWITYLSTDKRRVTNQRHEMGSERRQKLQILELTPCSHVELFVDSHPKFTCQTQSISGSHTWAWANTTFEFLNSTSGNKKWQSVCWRGTYDLFRWKQSMYSQSHANKHKLVTFLIPEHRQAKDCYAKDYKRSCFGSEIKGRNSWNLTSCTKTHTID